MRAWYFSASSPIVLASIGFGMVRRRRSRWSSGNHSVPVKPNEWKNGSTPMKQSSGRRRKDLRERRRRWRGCCACVSITPFGTPVLPLEKMMVAERVGRRASRGQSAELSARRQHERRQRACRPSRRRRTSCARLRGTPSRPSARSTPSQETARREDRRMPHCVDRGRHRFAARP